MHLLFTCKRNLSDKFNLIRPSNENDKNTKEAKKAVRICIFCKKIFFGSIIVLFGTTV